MGRKSWPNDKLLSRLINNKSNKTYWLNVGELRKRASSTFFEQCILLTKSDIQKERMIGVDILSQLSTTTIIRPFSKKVLTQFLKLLRYEKDSLVLKSILYGIGHNNENLVFSKDIKCIASYRANEYSYIREGVVFALLGIDNEIAIEALIDLSKDNYSNIRNWSTFGLGSQIEKDNLPIREALYERIKDKHSETKNEAIVGLAKRNDPRIREVIRQELLTDSYDGLLFEAIQELKDVTFLPLLENSLMKNKKDININPKWLEDLNHCIEELKLSNYPIN